MARYSVVYSRSAAKAFRRCHPQVQRRLRDVIEDLTVDAYPPGFTKIVGGEGERRVRVGDYRIVYDVDNGRLVVLVLAVGHKRSVYR